MAITHVNTNTGSDDGSSGSVTITKPTGTVSGDVLFATLASNEAAITAPSGFTVIEQSASGDTVNTFGGRMMFKVCGGSEPANYTWTKAADGGPLVVTLSAIRGLDITDPVDGQSMDADDGVASSGTPMADVSITTTRADGLYIYSRMSRSTTSLPAYTTSNTHWDLLGEVARFSGGSVRYGTCLFIYDTPLPAGTYTEPSVETTATTTDNVYILVGLKNSVPPTNAPATVAPVTATAYPPASLTVGTTAAYAPVTATAHDATVLTGKAAEDVDHAPITVTAYDAMGWVIHPVDVGVVAFDASVSVEAMATHAAVSVSVPDSVGYYGAPAARVWRIAAENRTWTIDSESRVYRVEA